MQARKVEGLGDGEKWRTIKKDERQKEVNKFKSRKRYAVKWDEIREKHRDIARRRRLMMRLEMTEKETG